MYWLIFYSFIVNQNPSHKFNIFTVLFKIFFLFYKNFVGEKSVDMITTVKVVSAIPMFLGQLFLSCYLFETINTQVSHSYFIHFIFIFTGTPLIYKFRYKT